MWSLTRLMIGTYFVDLYVGASGAVMGILGASLEPASVSKLLWFLIPIRADLVLGLMTELSETVGNPNIGGGSKCKAHLVVV